MAHWSSSQDTCYKINRHTRLFYSGNVLCILFNFPRTAAWILMQRCILLSRASNTRTRSQCSLLTLSAQLCALCYTCSARTPTLRAMLSFGRLELWNSSWPHVQDCQCKTHFWYQRWLSGLFSFGTMIWDFIFLFLQMSLPVFSRTATTLNSTATAPKGGSSLKRPKGMGILESQPHKKKVKGQE